MSDAPRVNRFISSTTRAHVSALWRWNHKIYSRSHYSPTCVLLHRNKHATASAAIYTRVAVRRIAMNEKIAARTKKSAARAPATGAFGRTPTKREEGSREF